MQFCVIIVTFFCSYLGWTSALQCLECNGATSDVECAEFGRFVLCHDNENSCQTTVRFLSENRKIVNKRCKQLTACENDMRDDVRDCVARKPHTFCTCCCSSHRCNKQSSDACVRKTTPTTTLSTTTTAPTGKSSCEAELCQNGGVCVQASSPARFRCQCSGQFTGELCELSKGPNCTRDSFEFGNSLYLALYEFYTFDEAATACARCGLDHLAYVEDAATYDALLPFLKTGLSKFARTSYGGYFWIGRKLNPNSGVVTFLNGREALWSKWVEGYPSDQDWSGVWWDVTNDPEDEAQLGFMNMNLQFPGNALCQKAV